MQRLAVAACLALLVGAPLVVATNHQDGQTKAAQDKASSAQPPTPQSRPGSHPANTEQAARTDSQADTSRSQPAPWFGPHNAADWTMVVVTLGGLLLGWRTLTLLGLTRRKSPPKSPAMPST
jgi:hypothetical protein